MAQELEEAARAAEQFAALLGKGEIDQPGLYAPDARGWHNTDEVWGSMSEARMRLAAIRTICPDFHAEEIELHPWAGGFAMQYALVGTMTSGEKVRIVGCVVATVAGGQITRVQEYVDSAHLSTLRKGLAAAVP